jgi:hypothetical protein
VSLTSSASVSGIQMDVRQAPPGSLVLEGCESRFGSFACTATETGAGVSVVFEPSSSDLLPAIDDVSILDLCYRVADDAVAGGVVDLLPENVQVASRGDEICAAEGAAGTFTVGCSDNADCDNGIFCDGGERCDPDSHTCLSGAPPCAGDGTGCSIDSCDEIARSCSRTSCTAGVEIRPKRLISGKTRRSVVAAITLPQGRPDLATVRITRINGVPIEPIAAMDKLRRSNATFDQAAVVTAILSVLEPVPQDTRSRTSVTLTVEGSDTTGRPFAGQDTIKFVTRSSGR